MWHYDDDAKSLEFMEHMMRCEFERRGLNSISVRSCDKHDVDDTTMSTVLIPVRVKACKRKDGDDRS